MASSGYLNTFDYTVIVVYACSLIGLTVFLRKTASASLENYLIGGRSLPWWLLGVSGMAGFLDVAGTMVIVSFLYLLGPRGLFVEFRGGAVLVLVLMMLWTGKWHRRSGCLTGAEWMIFRFGDGPGGRLAQFAKAIGAIIWLIGMLAYLIKAIGLFLSMFLPFSPMQCAVALMGLAGIYTMFSGFYGVVFTDLLQALIIVVAVVFISYLAMSEVPDAEALQDLAIGVTGNSEWSTAMPQWRTEMPPGYQKYEALIAFAGIYLLRNVLFGMGTGDDPRFLAARSDAECSKLSFLWTCLMSVRWPMMMGFAILGLTVANALFPNQATLRETAAMIKQEIPEANEENWQEVTSTLINSPDVKHQQLAADLKARLGQRWKDHVLLVSYYGTVNPERILPAVLLFKIPSGFRGLMLVALIAASMSTFDSNVNMTAGLFVRDIYQKYVRPTAALRELLVATWIFIAATIGVGFAFAYKVKSIHEIWDWIIMGLGGGMMIPNILRLYWWRFNGGGFAIGMTVGVAAAVAQRVMFPDMEPQFQLLIVGGIGLLASVLGALLTPPTDSAVLVKFYQTTWPFGMWGPLKKNLPDSVMQQVAREHRRDLSALPFAMTFQVMIFLAPMLLVIRNWTGFGVCALIAGVAFLGLQRIWLRHIHTPAPSLADCRREFPSNSA
ncbi:MAG: sodium:solute symporter [Planctomycetaceae bacterium]|nr:sodium:solute symporter [Planctomycetaceae bacterium]